MVDEVSLVSKKAVPFDGKPDWNIPCNKPSVGR